MVSFLTWTLRPQDRLLVLWVLEETLVSSAAIVGGSSFCSLPTLFSIGAVLFGLGFRNLDYGDAFTLMGCVIIASVVPTAFIFIKGHSSLFCGQDEDLQPKTHEELAKSTISVPPIDPTSKMEEEQEKEDLNC